MEIVEKTLSEIQPYEKNPRKNDAAVQYVEASIREFGFRIPIIIDKNGVIVCGHTRYKAARKMKLEKVPCIYADDLTEEQIRAFRIADNKTGEAASWDWSILPEELKGIKTIDMTDFGFLNTEVEDPNDVHEDNYNPEGAKRRTAAGQLWELGEHRLMIGDSTDPAAVKNLMGGELAEFVFTDPPYGVAIGDKNKTLNKIGHGGRQQENIVGDTLGVDDLYKMLVAAFRNLREVCAEDAAYYVSSPQGGEIGMMMMMMMKDAGLPVRHNLIWVKNNAAFSMGKLDYDYRHEPIFYTWTKKHNFYGGYQNTVIDDTKPIDKMSKSELKDLVRALQEDRETSVLYCDKPLRSEMHPTMKPVKLVARLMINSSRKGDIVADIFGGSGTTLIAAEQLGRKARLMEIDPRFGDVILDRWEKYTGRKAVLINEKNNMGKENPGGVRGGGHV